MAEVVAFDPHRARTYLHALKGEAHRYAWYYFRWRTGKRRGVPRRPREVSEQIAEMIRDAVNVGLGKKRGTVAPARFAGWQERPGGKPPIALYKLTAAIPGHPERSHVSGQTLVKAGFTLPRTPEPNGLIWTGGGGRNPRDPTKQILIGGIAYDILSETQDRQGALLQVRRPKGVKEYLARRLPDSPLYGESRGVIVHGLPRSRNPYRGRRYGRDDFPIGTRVRVLVESDTPDAGKYGVIVKRGAQFAAVRLAGRRGRGVWFPLDELLNVTPASTATGTGAGVCPKGHALHWSSASRERGAPQRKWCQVCGAYFNPPKSGSRFRHTRLEPPGRFDPRSFRTVRRGRTRVIVACPKRHYHSGRCRVGTRAQAILRGNPMSAAARRKYPGIVQFQEEIAAVYSRALSHYRGDARRARQAVELYLAGQATREQIARKSNPPRAARAGGGARLIYPSGRIRGVWEGRHKNGKLYRHRFGRGLKSVYGLPGGDVLLSAHQGRLWKTFF